MGDPATPETSPATRGDRAAAATARARERAIAKYERDLKKFVRSQQKDHRGARPLNADKAAAELKRTYNTLYSPAPNPPADPLKAFPEAAAGGGSGSFTHPFKLVLTVEGGVTSYTISPGTITDGTNGTNISLVGITDTPFAAAPGYVVIQADVDASFVVTNWAHALVENAAEAAEVGLTADPVPVQNKVRLYIGHIAQEGDTFTLTQACITSQRISYGFDNGMATKVFSSAPTHPEVA